ncbi:hypothetical protein K525DRAFT_193079 [Schizophyllum commune Loenen D]|nr:hypothetical protein K525DRAFT_193079 [Schizophyllum commune Loenen D]
MYPEADLDRCHSWPARDALRKPDPSSVYQSYSNDRTTFNVSGVDSFASNSHHSAAHASASRSFPRPSLFSGNTDDSLPADWQQAQRRADALCDELKREQTACDAAKASYARERADRRQNFVHRMNQTYEAREAPLAATHSNNVVVIRAAHERRQKKLRDAVEKRKEIISVADEFVARPHCRLPPQIEGLINAFLGGPLRQQLLKRIAEDEEVLKKEDDVEHKKREDLERAYRAAINARRLMFVQRELKHGMTFFNEEEADLDGAYREMLRMREGALDARKKRIRGGLEAYLDGLKESERDDEPTYLGLLESLSRLHEVRSTVLLLFTLSQFVLTRHRALGTV